MRPIDTLHTHPDGTRCILLWADDGTIGWSAIEPTDTERWERALKPHIPSPDDDTRGPEWTATVRRGQR